mmetsp:Transcript_118275/g.339371  ORF Transcript_118275/g.339371 Transcript_118275/m.339371 type:complete len:208 (+) Transcript_118275:2095-2718(+)
MPHHSQTTPLTSPVATKRPAGSIDTAVSVSLCACFLLLPHSDRQTTRSLPSHIAEASAVASNGPACSTVSGNNPAIRGASRELTSNCSTSAGPATVPQTTRIVPDVIHLNAAMGPSIRMRDKHVPDLESHNETCPLAPIASGSAHIELLGPAEMAVTRPAAGMMTPRCFPVRTLWQSTPAPQGVKSRVLFAAKALLCSTMTPLTNEG